MQRELVKVSERAAEVVGLIAELKARLAAPTCPVVEALLTDALKQADRTRGVLESARLHLGVCEHGKKTPGARFCRTFPD